MEKTRNWVGIGYPESLPEDWLDKLKSLHIKTFISPLHDSDVTEEGELKKPHYHIMLMYDNTVTFSNATSDFLFFGVDTLIKSVRSKSGMSRYLCHLDETDKFHYNIEDVIELSGADYSSAIQNSDNEYMNVAEIFDFIDDNRCFSFCALLRYLRTEKPFLFKLCLKNSATIIAIKEYQKSFAWESEKNAT